MSPGQKDPIMSTSHAPTRALDAGHPSHANWYNNAEISCRTGDAIGRVLVRILQ